MYNFIKKYFPKWYKTAFFEGYSFAVNEFSKKYEDLETSYYNSHFELEAQKQAYEIWKKNNPKYEKWLHGE